MLKELDARISEGDHTLIILEADTELDFARVRLVFEEEELVCRAKDGKDALDLFAHPFAQIKRFLIIPNDRPSLVQRINDYAL